MAPASPLQHMVKLNGGTHAAAQTPKKAAMEPNVLAVVLGDLLIKPWYPSFYPEEMIGKRAERLYVCERCFKYSKEVMPYLGHVRVCGEADAGPPGSVIYEKGDIAIYEVDGEDHKLYTQNLSLFAKLFLETKSVFYDVTTFLYYLLVLTDPETARPQVVGFFSKEKMSWDNNNLACIIVFPPWQRRGFGQVLMGVSYELGKREDRLGGPEKPISELGKRGYQTYWSSAIARYVLDKPNKNTVTVQEISNDTYIVQEDIIATLKDMQVLDRKKRQNAEAAINKAKVRAWAAANKASLLPLVDLGCFVLQEPTFENGSEAR